ncbi:MAG: M48 family metallopeptidase [Gammaproteobacteria bacterium]|nr:M48 family metallopeptidase [Gammaproteobacteria bacterium]TVQ50554.1 MAG: peptidase M48 [Gammaproteobacteria bacterium]
MDFFAAQEASLRRSRRLLLIFALACLLITAAVVLVVAALAAVLDGSIEAFLAAPGRWLQAHATLLIVTATATLAIIGLASTWRTTRLSQGGGEIARALGGTEVAPDTQDPQRARLRNVVEEMAIASGVPVPEIYVLENEPGINAFAAGYTPGDAAVAVTRGCLEQLNREELQGVIAHEFSHILNGDMRLNIRLMGVLFGILVIGMLGRIMLRGTRVGAMRVRVGGGNRSGGGGAAVLVILAAGLALTLIGSIGVLFGRLIRAGLSRQREFLADASAVQFTRNNRGIAGALRKIGGLDAGSHLAATDSEEVGHMLFARGSSAFRSLLATHPPLADRLAALGEPVEPGAAVQPAGGMERTRAGGVTAGFAPGHVSAAVGQFDASAVAYAGALRDALPAILLDAAHSREAAPLLLLALLLHDDERIRTRQLTLLGERLGDARCRRVADLAAQGAAGPRAQRLPLLEIAFPALKERPAIELNFYIDVAERLAQSSGEVELFEYCLLKLVEIYLAQAESPARTVAVGGPAAAGVTAISELLAIVAAHGQADPVGAYDAGRAAFAEALGARAVTLPAHRAIEDWQPRLDQALAGAAALSGNKRRATVAALAAVIAHDGRTGDSELQLLRVVCAALDSPLPPVLPAGPFSR